MSVQPMQLDGVAAELQALYDQRHYGRIIERFESLSLDRTVSDAAHAATLQIAAQAYLRTDNFPMSANAFLTAAAIFAAERRPAASLCMRNAFAALQRCSLHVAADWVALRSLSLPRECAGDVELLRHAVLVELKHQHFNNATCLLAAASVHHSTRTVALETLLDMARRPTDYGVTDWAASQPTADIDSHHPKLSIILCSRDDARYARFMSECQRAMGSTHFEIIRVANARSMCEGYNRGTDAATGDLLLYCHDDIEFITDDVHRALIDALSEFEVACCVGSSVVDGPTWVCGDATLSQGWMAARDAESGEYSIGMMGVPMPQSLLSSGDGCFIACRRATAQALRWDETTFDSFHLYDIDFCLRAAQSGARIGIARDVVINHLSLGTFDARWREQAARFAHKHGLVWDHVCQSQWISVPTGTRADTARVARNLTRLVPDEFQQQLAHLQTIRFELARREVPALETFQSSTDALAT